MPPNIHGPPSPFRTVFPSFNIPEVAPFEDFMEADPGCLPVLFMSAGHGNSCGSALLKQELHKLTAAPQNTSHDTRHTGEHPICRWLVVSAGQDLQQQHPGVQHRTPAALVPGPHHPHPHQRHHQRAHHHPGRPQLRPAQPQLGPAEAALVHQVRPCQQCHRPR